MDFQASICLFFEELASSHNKLHRSREDESITTVVLPTAAALRQATDGLTKSLPIDGIGIGPTVKHLIDDVVPGLNNSSLVPSYYGFVTGGYTEAAGLADHIASTLDQNVQVHLPRETVSTVVEHCAFQMLLELFDLQIPTWHGRTFTTGATASNVVGLACAREQVLNFALRRRRGSSSHSVGESGIISTCLEAGVTGIQILTTMPHSSLRKAASLIGLGRNCVKDVGYLSETPWKFDYDQLEKALRKEGMASIVTISCGEVNTGRFATGGLEEMQRLRTLCDKYGAWIHVDGAFGIFGRLVAGEDYDLIKRGCEGIELADSIAGDAHKLLNVPYDCGFVFCRSLNTMEDVFQNSNAAYLSSSATTSEIPSPLNVGIENSRRFRALPVYATLLAYGKSGYQQMLQRQMTLARRVVRYLFARRQHFELLPFPNLDVETQVKNTFIIVLFRAIDREVNFQLVRRINESRRIYVSGTSWEGTAAARIAISNRNVNPERDIEIIQEVLNSVISS
ncbi:MAG: hypothetical protein M1837_003506 [Sclerophora amabilis]|nr:MAG: hypothetical protein M1837_003506 [Sclerophora amabilis]